MNDFSSKNNNIFDIKLLLNMPLLYIFIKTLSDRKYIS